MSTFNTFAITCPDDCTTVPILPILDAEQNCAPVPKKSQVTDLWIKPNAATVTPFTGWTDGIYTVTANQAGINNAATDNSAVKWLVVEGGVADPDEEVQEVAKFIDIVSERTWTLNLTIKNVSDAHYDFARTLQCGNTDFTFWYGSTDYVYGKATGIVPTKVTARLPKGEGRTDVDQIVIEIEFKGITDPDRKQNPYS